MTAVQPIDLPAGPLRLSDLTAFEARRVLSSNPRLLVPAGTLLARGPHLPLGCDTLIVERLADDLSALVGIARTPALPFGASSGSDPLGAGSAELSRKTLHRLMNELIAAWETEAKVREFFILTAHAAEPHVEALSTIRTDGQVTLIDIYAGLTPDDGVGLRPETALLMWLSPSLVDRSKIPPDIPRDPDLGERLYRKILEYLVPKLRTR